MSEFSLDDIKDKATDVEDVKNLCPWLEDPHQCDCGAYCDSTHEYVEEQAMYMDVWKCPKCGDRYYRDRV